MNFVAILELASLVFVPPLSVLLLAVFGYNRVKSQFQFKHRRWIFLALLMMLGLIIFGLDFLIRGIYSWPILIAFLVSGRSVL